MRQPVTYTVTPGTSQGQNQCGNGSAVKQELAPSHRFTQGVTYSIV